MLWWGVDERGVGVGGVSVITAGVVVWGATRNECRFAAAASAASAQLGKCTMAVALQATSRSA